MIDIEQMRDFAHRMWLKHCATEMMDEETDSPYHPSKLAKASEQPDDNNYWKSAFDQLRKEYDALLKRKSVEPRYVLQEHREGWMVYDRQKKEPHELWKTKACAQEHIDQLNQIEGGATDANS